MRHTRSQARTRMTCALTMNAVSVSCGGIKIDLYESKGTRAIRVAGASQDAPLEENCRRKNKYPDKVLARVDIFVFSWIYLGSLKSKIELN